MAHNFAHTPRGTTILKRESIVHSKHYLTKNWYYRSRRSGRATYFRLGTDWKSASAKADEIAMFLSLPGSSIIEARERFSWGLRPVSPKTATIGDVLDKLLDLAPALSLSPSSLYSYRTSLLRLVRVALTERLRRDVTNNEVRAESCLVLTLRLASDYKLKVMSGSDGSLGNASVELTL